MADELATTTAEPTPEEQPTRTKRRIVKIGNDAIVLDDAMRDLTIDQLKQRLAQTGYPEAANATATTGASAEGDEIISFLPVAGRKG